MKMIVHLIWKCLKNRSVKVVLLLSAFVITSEENLIAQTSAPPEWPEPPHKLLILGTFPIRDAGLDSYRPQFELVELANVLETEGNMTTPQASANQHEIEAIRLLFKRWLDAVKRSDIDALLEMVADDAVFLPENNLAIVGKEAVAATYRAAFSQFKIEQSFAEEEIQICGDWAFVRGTESFTITPLNGGEPVSMEGRRAISILKKAAASSWKYARGMTNSSQPPNRK